jgi:hypothetical protein
MDSSVSAEVIEEEVATISPRLTIILHPNPSRIDIAVNDRMFNTEKYSFSRKKAPVGAEQQLLEYCETYIVGIRDAKAAKNILQLDITDGVVLKEFLPQVITAVLQWGSTSEPYSPQICVDNRRWKISPVYDKDGMRTISHGVRERPDQPDIGIPYGIWGNRM